MKTLTIKLTNEKAVLTAYIHDRSKEMPNTDIRPAVLIFPGGGYMFCSDREADPVALAYLAEGYNTFILRYSVGIGVPVSSAFFDAEEAIAYLIENADDFSIDKERIAVIGFSAGGHLAAWLSTYGSIKPAAAILGYPCILPELGSLMGKELPDLCSKVDASAPPTFIFTTRNDPIVPVKHALKYAEALDLANVAFEMHVFGDGVHGLSLARSFTSSGKTSMVNADMAQWFSLSANWLRSVFGDFPVKDEEPQGKSDALDIGAPLGMLMSNEKTRPVVLDILPQIAEIIKQAEESGQSEVVNSAPISEIARVRPELLEAEKIFLLGEILKTL